MRSLFFAYAWLFLSAGVILTSIAGYLLWLTPQQPVADTQPEPALISSPGEALSQLDPEIKGVQSIISTQDARAAIVAAFLQRHNSPLTPYSYYGQVFVDLADRYGFDFRLLPAIAMQESNLCKNIPSSSFNCLGFGIHERGSLAFDSFEANFDRAARELKAYYIDIGLTTPEDIMTKYTPASDGSWANSVNQWMTEMRYNDRQLGREINENSSVLEFVIP